MLGKKNKGLKEKEKKEFIYRRENRNAINIEVYCTYQRGK